MLLNAVGIPRLQAGEEVNAQPKEKMYTLKDGGSLFLEVFPTGGKYWRFGFRFPKGDKTKRKLSLGAYPKVSLKTAREPAQEARQQLAAGKDPRIQRCLWSGNLATYKPGRWRRGFCRG